MIPYPKDSAANRLNEVNGQETSVKETPDLAADPLRSSRDAASPSPRPSVARQPGHAAALPRPRYHGDACCGSAPPPLPWRRGPPAGARASRAQRGAFAAPAGAAATSQTFRSPSVPLPLASSHPRFRKRATDAGVQPPAAGWSPPQK